MYFQGHHHPRFTMISSKVRWIVKELIVLGGSQLYSVKLIKCCFWLEQKNVLLTVYAGCCSFIYEISLENISPICVSGTNLISM